MGAARRLHPLRDELGNVVGLTDAGPCGVGVPPANEPVPAKLVERYDHDPYGRTYMEHRDPNGNWVRTGASYYGNPFAWTAQRYDAGVKLYGFFARTYSPELGRWLQRDPAGHVDGTNLYQYVRSMPTRFTDPLGMGVILPPSPSPGGGGDNGGDQPAPPDPNGPGGIGSCPGRGSQGGGLAPPVRPPGPNAPESPDPSRPHDRKFQQYPPCPPGQERADLGNGVKGPCKQPNDPHGNCDGCGSGLKGKLVPNSPSGFPFGRACNEHDRCYETPGKTKDQCDNEFLNDMLNMCDTYADPQVRSVCRSQAETYYAAVVEWGDGPYAEGQAVGRKRAEQEQKKEDMDAARRNGTVSGSGGLEFINWDAVHGG